MESIHDLFNKVQEHPDYVFGTVFVRDDFAPEHVESLKDSATAVDAMVEAGWDAADFELGQPVSPEAIKAAAQ